MIVAVALLRRTVREKDARTVESVQDAYAVALEEGRRGIDQQRDDLKSVRDRAPALLTVSGVAAAFLGGIAFRVGDEEPGRPTLLAVAAFVVIAFLVGKIHRWKPVTFAQDAGEIASWVEHARLGVLEVRQAAAYLLRPQLRGE